MDKQNTAKITASIDMFIDVEKALRLTSALRELNLVLVCPDCGMPVRPRQESSVFSKTYTAAHFVHVTKNPNCPRFKKDKP